VPSRHQNSIHPPEAGLALTYSSTRPQLVGRKARYAFLFLIALFATSILSAQEPAKPPADVESLFKDNDPRISAMKQSAYHIERDLLQCNLG